MSAACTPAKCGDRTCASVVCRPFASVDVCEGPCPVGPSLGLTFVEATGHPNLARPEAVAFLPDGGRRAVALGDDGSLAEIQIVAATFGAELSRAQVGFRPDALAFTEDGERLLSAGSRPDGLAFDSIAPSSDRWVDERFGRTRSTIGPEGVAALDEAGLFLVASSREGSVGLLRSAATRHLGCP